MEDAFVNFASFGSGGKKLHDITLTNYLKMLKATGIIDKHYPTVDAELLFAKGGSKTMSFDKFRQALATIAAAKKTTVEALEEAIVASGGPSASGTSPTKSAVVDRLTDTSQYTGAHKERFDADGKGKGLAGRESVSKGAGALPNKSLNPGPGHVRDLSELTDRTPSDVRGVKYAEGESPPQRKSTSSTVISSPEAKSLDELFHRFCSISGGSSNKEMDGSKFAKLCRDCGLIGKKLTATDVDLIFTKCKDKSARKIDMQHFSKAIHLIAEHMHLPFDEVEQMMLHAGGPKLTGTAADNAQIVDKLTDTHGYTGAHKERFDADGKGKGLEGRVQATGTADLSDLTDRTAADVRGVKKH